MENDEYESLLAAFPDWETREVGKATFTKTNLEKSKKIREPRGTALEPLFTRKKIQFFY